MLRARTLVLMLAAALVAGGAGLIGWGMRDPLGLARVLPSAVVGAANHVPGLQLPAPAPTADPAHGVRRQQQRRERALTRALDAYADEIGPFSVAVLDHRTGRLYAYRGDRRYEAASVVKADLLAALLLKAQDDERRLSADELSLARRMIRTSDNDAATALYDRVGRIRGLTAVNRRLGLRATSVDRSWGLTTTTAVDQARLVGQLAATVRGPIHDEYRDLARELMAGVAGDQNWGISAAARDGETVALKNGWLPRPAEDNRWIVNSVGRITGADVDVSIAVLSHRHASMQVGVRRVERIARMTREHLKW